MKIYLRQEIYDALRVQAKELSMTPSQFVSTIIIRTLGLAHLTLTDDEIYGGANANKANKRRAANIRPGEPAN